MQPQPRPSPAPPPPLSGPPSGAPLRSPPSARPARSARKRAPGASWTLRSARETDSGPMLGTGERPRHAFPAAAPCRVVDRNHGPPAPPRPVRRRTRRLGEYRGIALDPNIEGERRRASRDASPEPAPGSRLAKRDIHWDIPSESCDIPSESNGISRPSQMGYHVRVIWDIPSESNRISRLSRMG